MRNALQDIERFALGQVLNSYPVAEFDGVNKDLSFDDILNIIATGRKPYYIQVNSLHAGLEPAQLVEAIQEAKNDAAALLQPYKDTITKLLRS